MRSRRTVLVALTCAGFFTTLGAAPLLAQEKGGGDTDPVTLSLAVWDHPGRQAEQAALDLVALAPELSGGEITVAEPLWGASDAAELVRSGQVDLAILATREWSPFEISSLDALEAPFLIDDDALADAVAQSDIADAAMAGLEDLGVHGLAMWPEDLRHLFAYERFGRAFQTPADFSGATILAIAGPPGQELITTLGGEVYQEGIETDVQTGDRDTDSGSGALDGMVTGLWGAGLSEAQIDGSIVAADVVLYPKFQMLVANGDALARLSEAETAALDDIASEVQRRAVERRSREVELGAALCERGGTVVQAGSEAVAHLQEAARPLWDAMASDPVVGAIMGRIGTLAGETPRSTGAGTCGTHTSMSSYPISDTTGFSSSAPPDGDYRANVSFEDLLSKGVPTEWARNNSGTFTFSFVDGTYTLARDGRIECEGTYQPTGTSIALTDSNGGCAPGLDIRWQTDADGIALALVGVTDGAWPLEDFTNVQAHLEGRTWTKIDGPMPTPASGTSTDAADTTRFIGSELVPAGTYRTVHSAADLAAAGARPFFASVNDGTWTLTVDGDAWELLHTGNRVAPSQPTEECSGTQSLDGDNIRFTTVVSRGCGFDYDVRWRLDGDDLWMSLAGLAWSDDPVVLVEERAFTDRAWTRIGGASAADPSPRVLPEGTYRADISVEDLESKGATHEQAISNAGIATWVLEDAGGSIVMESDIAAGWDCPYTLSRTGEAVVLDMPPSDCDPGVYTMTLDPQADVLVPTVLATIPSSDHALVKAFFERPWTRID